MKTGLILLVVFAALTGCSSSKSKPTPIDWRDYVTPLENGEYVTVITSNSQSDATGFARKMMWSTCDHYQKTPEVIASDSDRTGLLSEKTADVHDVIRSVANSTGNWLPSINDETYKHGIHFKCATS